MEKHFDELKKGLNITKYEVETDAAFVYRMIYSALGAWARVSACYPAKDINGDVCAPTKSMIHRFMKQSLNTYLTLWPELKKMFYPDDSFDSINSIRDVLVKSGELIEVGFDSRLTLDSPYHKQIAPNVTLERSMVNHRGNVSVSGLALLSEDKTEEYLDLLEMYGIPEKSCAEVLEERLSIGEWTECDDFASLELFDAKKEAVLSSCWTRSMKLEINDVYMARKKLEFSNYEYMLIKKTTDKYLRMSFWEYEQHTNVRETQRLLYGLRMMQGNIRTVAVYKYSKYSVYYFWSKLPAPEDLLLRYIGWPKDDIKNSRNIFIVDNRLSIIVEKIIHNLGMRMEVHNE